MNTLGRWINQARNEIINEAGNFMTIIRRSITLTANTLTRRQRIIQGVQSVVALLPIIWIVLFYVFGFHIAHLLGHWPTSMIDDPQRTVPDGFWWDLDQFLLVMLFGILFLTPAWIVLCLLRLALPMQSATKPTLRTIFFWIGIAGMIYVGQGDPHHLYRWWMD